MEKAQELLIGGGTTLLAEIAANSAHSGLGMVLGGCAGVVAYQIVRQVKEHRAGGLLPAPVQKPRAPARKPQDHPSLMRRLVEGKSTRALGSEQALEEQFADGDDDAPDEGMHVTNKPGLALYLGSNFYPNVNMLLEQGVFCCGIKRSGKTSVLALIIEQISRFGVPLVAYDKEGDLISLLDILPNGVLVDRSHWYSAQQILTHNLQVVVDLQSWDTDDERAAIMVTLVRDLLEIASQQEPGTHKPCPQFLDEAQYWLPQERVDYLSKESLTSLSSAFAILLSTGGKRGLTPFCFTQRLSQTRKSIVDLGVQIFMRQVLDIDQQRAMNYIRTATLAQEDLAAFAQGQGVVCLPGGVQLVVKFDQRRSVHVSKTPTVERVGYQATQKIQATPVRRATFPQPFPVSQNGNQETPVSRREMLAETAPQAAQGIATFPFQSVPETPEMDPSEADEGVSSEKREIIKRANQLKIPHGDIAKLVGLSGRKYKVYQAVCREIGITTGEG